MELNLIFNEESISNPSIKETKNISDIVPSAVTTNIKEKLWLEDINLEEGLYNKIYIGDILSFIDIKEFILTINQLKFKLSKDGLICIEEYDQLELCLAVINDEITSPDFNAIIKNRNQILNIQDIVELAGQTNLKIISKDIDSIKHYIELQNV